MTQYITDLRQLGINPTAVPDALLAAKNKLNEIPFNPTPIPALLYGLATDPQATAAAYDQSNLPVGNFLIGNADRALRGSQDPLDYLDLGLLGADVVGAGSAVSRGIKSALTSNFAKDLALGASDLVYNQAAKAGFNLQPQIVIGERSPLFNQSKANDFASGYDELGLGVTYNPTLKKFEYDIPNFKKLDHQDLFEMTGTYVGRDRQLRQRLSDAEASIDFEALNDPESRKNILGNITHITNVGLKERPDLSPENLADTIIYNIIEKDNLKGINLDKFFKHPTLFKAYPETRNIKVYPYVDENTKDFQAAFDRENNRLFINLAARGGPDQLKGSILHEVQHNIQAIEGFDTGAPYGLSQKEYESGLNKTLGKHFDDVYDDIDEYFYLNDKDPTVRSIIDEYVNNPLRDMSKEVNLSMEGVPYQVKAGEVEARNVEATMDLSQEELDKSFPYRTSLTDTNYTQDVPLKLQIRTTPEIENNIVESMYGNRLPDFKYQKNNNVVQPLINEFLVNTPTKPNERVGKRFTIEDRSNNVPIETLKAEDLIGKTIVTKPTDLTSRDKFITSVSDLKLPYPLLTEGGELFGAAKKNVDRDVFYASNYSAALGDVNRLKEALELDKARGGTGVIYAPTSMAQHSSNFSTMPTGLLMNFVYDGIRTGRMTKPLIKELDEEIRTGKGLQAKSALPDWKGLMTQEGRDQLRQYGGKYRIGLAAHMMKNQKYQKALGFNNEDVVNALRDEHNRGVGEHMLGNIFYKVDPNVDMRLSSTPLGSGHGSYMFDLIHGRPAGKLPNAIHMETLLGDPYLKDLVEGKITGKNYNKLTKTGKEQTPSTILRQGLNAIHTQQGRPDVYKFITESDAERIDDYLKAIRAGLLEL